MWKGLKEYITKRIWPPARLQYVIIIILCFTSTVIACFRPSSVASIAVLSAFLTCLAWLLLDTKITLDKIESEQSLDRLILEFEKCIPIIKESLSKTDEVWLLTSSGVGWFKDFPQLEDVVNRSKKSRFIFVDPRDHDLPQNYRDYAFQMLFERTDFRKEHIYTFTDYQDYRKKMKNHIFTLVNKYINKADFKVIDYLPSWTLLILQPKKKYNHCTVFVEFRPFESGYVDRPIMKLTPKDGIWFQWFVDEFDRMWNSDNKNIDKDKKIHIHKLTSEDCNEHLNDPTNEQNLGISND
ncbi:MAG: hypothetical protein GY797_12145 [Deltaproteobacteria bacterium]|nr:hypothetical protein [Deltaproteobacteria bacterium]